jgi:antitoxin VapB
MALSIKTKEADRLARELAQLTGESMTEAVTKALSQRLERERASRKADPDEVQRLLAHAARIRAQLDCRPVTKEEIDDMWGDGT